LFRPRLDAFRDSTRGRVDAGRPGAEDESVGDDRLAVRTKGCRAESMDTACLITGYHLSIFASRVTLLSQANHRSAALRATLKWPLGLDGAGFRARQFRGFCRLFLQTVSFYFSTGIAGGL